MIYRSNLKAPELEAAFTLSPEVRQMMGHDVPSDPDFEPGCGFMTHDEAAILYTIALSNRGTWLDIGARFGWSSAHILAGGCGVVSVDPHFHSEIRTDRFLANIDAVQARFGVSLPTLKIIPKTSREFFASFKGFANGQEFAGAMIDGDHDSPVPLDDANGALNLGIPIVVFHDFQGKPIQDGVNYLLDAGYSARVYSTPNGVAVCWDSRKLPGFAPPDHVPDPAIDWRDVRVSRCRHFDLSRCS